MPSIRLEAVNVTFRLYDSSLRSIKRAAFHRASDLTAPALERVDLRIGPGERIAVLGANSSGKTTLLRVFAGILRPLSGHVDIDGRVGAAFAMGYGFDIQARLRDIVYAEGLLMGQSAASARRKVGDVLALADVEDNADTPGLVMPRGTLNRVALAAMIVFGADIFLLDEVLETIDPQFIRRFRDLLSAPEHADAIVVIVERSRAVIGDWCDRALLLDRGRVVHQGPLTEVLAQAAAVTF